MSNRPETRDGSLWADADGEAALRRFRALADVVDDGIFHLDASGQFVSVDETFLATTGFEREELLGEHVSTLLAEGDGERLDRSTDDLDGAGVEGVEDDGTEADGAAGDGPASLEATVRRADGETVPCELRYAPVHDGGTGGVVGLLREVEPGAGSLADGRWLEGALRESEAEFRRIADHLDEVVWMSAADQRDIRYVNPAFEEIWGRDRERLYEDAGLLLESVHPEDRERIQRELDKQVEDEYEVEYRIVRPDGEVRWIHDSAIPVRDDDGEVYRVVGEARDVTERKERERALEERERQLSTLMNNVPGMVYRCRNEQGWPMEFVSGGCRDLTGYDPEALERGDVSYGEEIVHEADREELLEDVQQGLADDGSFLVTYRIETADGDVRWVRERGRGIETDDEVELIEGVIIDVTERKRLETELDEILGRVTDGFYALDDEWRFTHVNERAEELLARTEEELLGKTLWEEFPETAAVDEIRESFEAAMETQEQTDLEIYSDLLGFWVEASIYPSETGLSVYFRDVTDRKRAQQRLQEERDMFAEGPAVVFRWNPDADEGWPVEYVSENVEEVFGYTPAELESGEVPYTDLLLEEELDRIAREVEENSDDTTERFTHDPYRVRTKDGEIRWVKDITKIVRDDAGEITNYLGYLVDITERKERERELQRYERIVENLPVGVYRNTPGPDGEFVEMNSTLPEIFDADDEAELQAVNVSDLYPEPERREEFSRQLEREGIVHDVELEQETLDGRRIWISVTAIRTEEDGEVYFDGIVQDVTERKERERALEESEQRYRALVENFPNGAVGLVDEELRYVTVGGDPRTDRAVTADDLEGQHVREVLSERLADAIEPRYVAAFDGESSTFEFEHEAGDRYSRFHVFPVRDEDGEVFAALGMSQDITEQRRRERELERTKERYRSLAENFPNGGVGVFDEDLRYTLVTGTMWDDIEPDAADLEGNTVREALPPETADDVEPIFRGALEGKTGTVVSQLGGRTYRVWATPLRDADGEITGGQSFALDITDRLERERHLERYETIVEAVNDGVYVVDADGHFTMVNEAYAEMLDYDREELLGEHVSLVVDDEDVLERAQEVEAAMRAGTDESPTVEAELETASGDWLPAEATFAMLPGEDDTAHRVGVARDISDRRERERELQRKERRYEAVFEDPNILVGLLEPDGTVLDINRTAMEYIDADLDDVTDVPFWKTPWWGESDEVRADVKGWVERAATGEYVDFQAELTRPDGEEYVLEGYFRPVTDEDGEVVSLIVSDRDVTERRQRERELEESERRYRALAENFPNGLVTMFDHDLEYQLAAGQGFDRIPHEPDDLVGESFRDVFDDETTETLEPLFQAALDGEEQSVELAYGGREWIVRAVPITDERGDVFAGMTMAQDITEQKERERYLEDAKSQFEAATEAGAVGTWEWDIQADEMIVGESFARTFGVDPEEAREGVPLERFVSSIHPADRDRVEEKIEAAVESCGEYEAEYRVRNADGELRWVVARGSVEADEDGEPVRFPGAVTDITERKRAELELERNNEQLETLFEVLPVGVVVADPDGGFVEANDTAREIWGGDVFDADSVEEYEKYPVRRADTGEEVPPQRMTLARVLDGEEVTEPDIYEIDAMDGETRIIRLEGMPVRDETGEVVRGVVTLTDVTERKEAQRRLEESERRYRTLVENFPNGAVGLFDEELEYTAVGGQLLEEIGLDPEERVGNSVTDVYPEELLSEIEPNFQAALDGEANSFEVEFHGRQLHCNTLPVRNADDEVYAGMLVVQDVTERREYERRLEASNERLEQFAYAASHDLQEPLRMVSSYLQLVDSRYGDELDEDGREFLEFAVDGADRMREMIDGLLQYSRVETQGDPLEPVDLDDVLADVRRDLEVRIEESDAEITAEPLPRILGDRSQLHQVFQNLLSNAIEYSGDEPPRVHVAAEPDGDRYEISVRDEGIGIDPEEADSVFEVFERLHSQAEHGGTGIGLALCRRIVERHGGDIRVESEPGEGSTFTFTLPAAGEDDD